jgi:hypothetical protein
MTQPTDPNRRIWKDPNWSEEHTPATGTHLAHPPPAPPPQQAAEDDGIPLTSGLRRLATSAKAIVTGLAVAGAIVMNVTGRIDGKSALEFITFVVMGYLGAHALEDSAEKVVGGRSPSTSNMVARIGALAPLFIEAIKAFTPQPQPGPVYRPMTPEELTEIEEAALRVSRHTGAEGVDLPTPPKKTTEN